MLSDHRHHVAGSKVTRSNNALDRKIIRFGRTAREHNLGRPRSDEGGNLATGGINGSGRFSPKRMGTAGRIAKVLTKIRQHGVEHARVEPRRRMTVHVDRQRYHDVIGTTAPWEPARETAKLLISGGRERGSSGSFRYGRWEDRV